MMAKFTKTMNKALSYSCSRGTFTKMRQDNVECNYCGGQHYIQNCDKVEEEGKCKKNHGGKIVLPNGFFVSRSIPGKWMLNRFFEWHRRNPSNQATATLVHTIKLRLLCTPPDNSTTTEQAQTTYQLTANNCIAVLEAELFNFRTRMSAATQGPQTRAQRARGVTIEEEEEDGNMVTACAQLKTPRIEDIDDVCVPQSQRGQAPLVPAHVTEHPFKNAKDVAYMPLPLKMLELKTKLLLSLINVPIPLTGRFPWFMTQQLQLLFSSDLWKPQ